MGKRLNEIVKLIDKSKTYILIEAVALVKKAARAKFDETIEVHIRVGIDPKRNDQIVRGTLSLPHGIGKTRKIAVLAKGEKQREAEAADADIVGAEDLIEEISKGKLDFDILVATPDIMRDLSKVAKVLGPKGLMPSPKSGTVTFEIGATIRELKKGRVEYKNDPFGIIHVPVGKASFEENKLVDNIKVLVETVAKAKPAKSKGQYVKSVSISSTMGPGIFVAYKM